MQLWLGSLKGRLRSCFVATVDGRFDLFDKGSHAAQPRVIDGGAFLGLAEALFR
jgi:hypothetical protein